MSQEPVERVLAGDIEAFRFIILRYGPQIRALLASQLADQATVDDLAQDTFMAAYEGLETFQPEANMGAWLKGIARNKLLMHLRTTYRRNDAQTRLRAEIMSRQLSHDASEREDDQDQAARRIERLRACLGKLPEAIKSVVMARYLDHEPVTAIAARLQTTVNAISATLFRSRKRLKTCVESGT
ncbi:MAG: sigma-70 family RNA polymerase sigma factor [Planctomycetota bacterium]|mgnify:CR=1 FL=1